ncbi:MAG: ArsR family transcriptional regulator [Leptolinea sp.]|jgi:predicted ArsR family transcriptional regulator|nr:ArsR family transcriptional regulator [Leptolinea sp.]
MSGRISTTELILSKMDYSQNKSAHELALECCIEEPTVRYHLRKLRTLGVVQEFRNTRAGLKAGRKATLFRRVNNMQENSIQSLCNTLLRQFLFHFRDDNEKAEQRLARLIIGEKPVESGIPMNIRELTQWLSENQYRASWEAGKTGPVIKFANCPYREIRENNEILCAMDAYLLRELNASIWELQHPMDWQNLQGNCRFVVKENTNR